jgi:hypothetical protein
MRSMRVLAYIGIAVVLFILLNLVMISTLYPA